ncbi:MAG: Nif3-like dinuclear metal center hexameric protein [Planctomycetales bacterium]
MNNVAFISDFLDRLAPASLAADWDNVGLLVGDREAVVDRVMTCLTMTCDTVAEAIDCKANLVITHHPLPFQPLKRITRDTHEGRFLLDLISANIAIYSAHTAFDSAATGINQSLAEGFGLQKIRPIVSDCKDDQSVGTGRCGRLPQSIPVKELVERIKGFLDIPHVRMVGEGEQSVEQVGIACGSAGSVFEPARLANCDVFITGETSFHTCLSAEAAGMILLVTGHFASERFAMQQLADHLDQEFPDTEVWASRNEKDPLKLA